MTSAHFYDTRTVPGWEHTLRDRPTLTGLRHEVSEALAPKLNQAVLDDLLLVLNELVTNSYSHTDAPRLAQIALTDAGILVEVSDGDTEDLRLLPLSPARVDGRGLALVGALSDDWGVVSTDDGEGKTVWALLRRTP